MRLPLIITILAIAMFSAVSKRVEAVPASAIRTQSVYSICNTKTSTIRNVSQATKREVYKRDGVPGGNHKDIYGQYVYEVDHIINLGLGGSNRTSNLKIQAGSGYCNYHDKDKLENKLHALVCSKKIGVKQAQYEIYNDWVTAYKKYVNPKGCG